MHIWWQWTLDFANVGCAYLFFLLATLSSLLSDMVEGMGENESVVSSSPESHLLISLSSHLRPGQCTVTSDDRLWILKKGSSSSCWHVHPVKAEELVSSTVQMWVLWSPWFEVQKLGNGMEFSVNAEWPSQWQNHQNRLTHRARDVVYLKFVQPASYLYSIPQCYSLIREVAPWIFCSYKAIRKMHCSGEKILTSQCPVSAKTIQESN